MVARGRDVVFMIQQLEGGSEGQEARGRRRGAGGTHVIWARMFRNDHSSNASFLADTSGKIVLGAIDSGLPSFW